MTLSRSAINPVSRRSPIKRRKPLRATKYRVPIVIRRYWDSLPATCQVPGCGAEAVLHHILGDALGKIGRRDHMIVVKLCPGHHNMGDVSVHLLGSEAAFERETGVDLVAIAVANRARWEGRNG